MDAAFIIHWARPILSVLYRTLLYYQVVLFRDNALVTVFGPCNAFPELLARACEPGVAGKI